MAGLSLSLGLSLSHSGAASLAAQIADNGAFLALYDPADTGTILDGAGNPVVQGDSDPIATVQNTLNPGTYDMVQTTSANQPVYNNGFVFDGTDDYLTNPIGASNADFGNATLVFIAKTTDTKWMIGGTDNSSYFAGVAEDAAGGTADTGVGTPTYRVGGAAISPDTRDDLHTAWATGSAVVGAVVGADYNDAAISSLRNYWAAASGFANSGNIIPVAWLDGDHANYADGLALAEQWANEKITELGL